MQGNFNKSSDLLKKKINSILLVGLKIFKMGTGNQRAALFGGNDE